MAGHSLSVQVSRQLIVQNGVIFLPYLTKRPSCTYRDTFYKAFSLTIYVKNRHCSLIPAKICEFRVVRPEWLLESVNIEYLLPWNIYIYLRKERIESTQGAINMYLLIPGKDIARTPLSITSRRGY